MKAASAANGRGAFDLSPVDAAGWVPEWRARLRAFLGKSLGLLLRLWLWTLRPSVEVHPGVCLDGARRNVFAFFHGQQMALLCAGRHRPACAMVSLSTDGELQASVMRALGVEVVRGSASRGGARALRQLTRRLREGFDALFAVDGPRGPRGIAKPGAAIVARLGGAHLVPVASAGSRGIVIKQAWDHFEVPWPFSRVRIVVGAPICADEACRDPDVLSNAIQRARAEARALVGSSAESARGQNPALPAAGR